MYMMNDREFSNRKETLHGEFYENALKYPERIALIYENEKVSYAFICVACSKLYVAKRSKKK